MSERTSTLVECPVCEAEFDPTAAGGWCTNSDCGEWRYEGADLETSEGAESADSSSENASPDGTDGDAANGPTPAIRRVTDETATTDDSNATDSDDGGVEAATAAIEEGVAAVGETTQSAAETVEDEGRTGEGGDTESATGGNEIVCPGCEETLDADANFCPSCGEDVSAVEPDEGDEELTTCPGCGADVGPEDSFCASCGEDLDAHRGPEELTECPGCGTDVEPEDSFCVSCGEDLDAHRESGSEAASETGDTAEPAEETGSAPESLVLDVRGEELTVEDGDTVGRKLRRIITETGGDEEDAVRVHREHVRFVRDGGRFYVEDLGRNPTTLNDAQMEAGDRKPVSPGDELTLSGIVTLAVREP